MCFNYGMLSTCYIISLKLIFLLLFCQQVHNHVQIKWFPYLRKNKSCESVVSDLYLLFKFDLAYI